MLVRIKWGFFFKDLYFWKLLPYVYLHNITYIWITPNERTANTDILARVCLTAVWSRGANLWERTSEYL